MIWSARQAQNFRSGGKLFFCSRKRNLFTGINWPLSGADAAQR